MFVLFIFDPIGKYFIIIQIMTKEQLRRISMQKLKNISTLRRYYFSQCVNANLLRLLKDLGALDAKRRSVLVYLPMPHEADISKTIAVLRKKSNVLVPFMEDISCKMIPLRLPLAVKKYAVKEPKVTSRKIKKVGLMIVPVIAFDKVFRRIGFGKGVYDRLFASLGFKPIVIFVQTVLCYEDSVVTKDHDISADYVVTAKGIFTKAITYDTRSKHSRRFWGGGGVVYHKKDTSKQIRFFSSRS
ncbi:MAG: 5-formyltetrahydrofolate cyclo-ligase [Helicobacteraceae bacterium]